MPAHTIAFGKEADVPVMVNLLYHEKISLPINQLMWKQWPNEAPQKARIESAVRGSLSDPIHTVYKIIDDEVERVVGLLVLTRRQPPTLDVQGTQPTNEGAKPTLPPELRQDVTEAIMAAIGDIEKDSTHVECIGLICLFTHG